MIGLVMIYHATSFYRDQGLVTSLEHILSCPDRLEQTKEVRFIRHTERYDLTMAGDPHWEAILPSNGGFITVGDGANGSTTIMGISMFHQLHCLQIIRKAFQGYVDMGDKVDLRDEGHGMQDAHAHHHGGQRHWVHCLDYLAQVRLSPLSLLEFTSYLTQFSLQSVSHVRRTIL